MKDRDRADFAQTLGAVHALYRQEMSETLLGIWWEALKPYELVGVRLALNRHAVNPDSGQFMPKPADVVKMIQGGTLDAAMLAWATVQRTILEVGCYRTVAFDDPIIHAVIADMGGWPALGAVAEKELPFRAKEFENRYRGILLRGKIDRYPPTLIGIAEGANKSRGLGSTDEVVLIGDPKLARRVMEGAGSAPMLQVSRFVALAAPVPEGKP